MGTECFTVRVPSAPDDHYGQAAKELIPRFHCFINGYSKAVALTESLALTLHHPVASPATP